MTQKENNLIFEPIYKTGYNAGKNDIKCKFRCLFDTNND